VEFAFTNPVAHEVQKVKMTFEGFAERLRYMLYNRYAASQIPFLIHHAAQGDFVPFAAAAFSQSKALYEPISLGKYFSVTCADSIPFITETALERATVGTFVGKNRIQVHRAACREWVRTSTSRDFVNPVDSSVPVLIVSSDVDPATPLYALETQRTHLPNATLIVLPFAGHDYTDPCTRELMAEFIRQGAAKPTLDTSCVQQIRRPPFAD
jgi:pimeloyl-ACP methyl ester carboxylesterase